MTDDVFERLAEALDRLPNGFPRTDSGVEIRILQKIFSPEEAALASQLTGRLESVDEIARRTGQPAGEVSRQLFKMVRRGMVWLDKQDTKAYLRPLLQAEKGKMALYNNFAPNLRCTLTRGRMFTNAALLPNAPSLGLTSSELC